MSRPKYDPSELEPTGKLYPGVKVRFKNSDEIPQTPVLNRPIEARENYQLLFSGKKPYWIPTGGWFFSDQNQFRPRINMDNVANHQVFDGGPRFDFSRYGDVIKSDWLDLEWQWVEQVGGATVRPGQPAVPDISHWEDYVTLPDLDAKDWEACGQENQEYLNTDKMNQLGIQYGFWERLMSLMDVAEASVALIDDDQKEGIHRLFRALTDLYKDYVIRIQRVCRIDSVLIHDDWAHKNGQFFSTATLNEMIMPYYKEFVKFCHQRGLSFEIHCCGYCEQLIPSFIETGADMWRGQSNINDMGAYAKKYKDEQFVFGIPGPELPMDADPETIDAAAKAWVEEYKDCKVALAIAAECPLPDGFVEAAYKYSRIAYQDWDE